ncbi:RNA polymerase sigma factor [Arachidicoccus soli]|uniref:Sigma-70 family RNA polymerase sigma factor n=1 Tax=Arachidicoccus soli TaxID=2341117 RepID=A0A386HU30_9BACT|nr:sigma-70 family RNA polymerase sigma factor [Arachidicoccus soli]AYD48814.1 sigma-70 family RNA polymerase sigma factor [Arachidicoccus soli]
MKLVQMHTIDDLIDGCKAGNRLAQQKLYNQFSGKMFAICLRYARDQMSAEDILQISFVKVFNKITEFKNEGSLEGWIRRIVVNTAIENYRKNIKLLQVASNDNAAIELADDTIFDKLEVNDLLKLVNSLPDGYRLVFNMYAIEGFSHKEIADILKISEGGSKSQLSRARQILKKAIQKREVGYAKSY